MRTIQTITTSIFLSAILFSCKQKEAAIEENTKVCISDSLSKIIKIDSASNSNIEDELSLSGEISFSDNKVVKVFPFSSGKVMQVKVSLGDKVSLGQVLAIIKSADVAGNYSDLSTSGNDVAIAKRQMENTESLYKNGIASEREFTEAKQNYQKSLTNSAKVQSQISINGGGHTSANGDYVVTAPRSGYVVEKKITEGAFIRNDNADNMFTIGDISEVWVIAYVYETDIAKVKEGYTAKVSTLAYPGKIFTGKVDKISQVLEPTTKVMKIRIRLSNSEMLLKPEMFANILIENKEGQQSVSIPAESIVSDNGNNYVVKYKSNCDLKVQQVDIIKTVGNTTFLRSGLAAGEKVIAGNQLLLFTALTEK
jgi:cobalt-zinc-cadmium efflux system membrane fusion protein